MNMHSKNFSVRTFCVLGGCVLFVASAFAPVAKAQNPPPPNGRFEQMRFLGARPFAGGKVVTGAPYSAQAVTEHTQTLQDGNNIHTTITANVYRDSQGRTRREGELGAVGPWAVQGNAHKVITITDPVAGFIHTLNPDTQVAREMPFRAHAGAGNGTVAGEHRFQQRHESANVTTESLGTQVIGGVAAQGTRITRTIPAGQVGNQAPILITVERWYSPELQTDVMRKEMNPQFGQTTFQLTNIVRAEPDAALFQVPANYTLESGRPFSMNQAPRAPEQ